MHITSEIQKKNIHFLDLTITLTGDWGCTHEGLSQKTSTNGFLHWDSHHPASLKQGIPVGQYLCARRNCSDDASFKEECDKLYHRFRQRGYPKKNTS